MNRKNFPYFKMYNDSEICRQNIKLSSKDFKKFFGGGFFMGNTVTVRYTSVALSIFSARYLVVLC